jgi:hypothetical protein
MRYEKQRKQSISGHTLFISMVFLAFIMLMAFSQAWALSCDNDENIISEGQSVTLDSDFGPCSGTALKITGPARLNLNGFTVFGGGNDGIDVQGEGATILNGTVSGAKRGIRVRGDGNHKVLNVTVINCIDRGIKVESDNNWLINNYIENSNKGIRVDQGSEHNNILGNTMVNNNAENCDVQGSSNVIANNIARGKFKLESGECFLIGDLESSNVTADNNLLMNNTALNCQGGGFVAAGGTLGNFFVNNTARKNSPYDLIDNTYGAPNCEDESCCTGNTWLRNTARSGNPECILSIRKPWGCFRH